MANEVEILITTKYQPGQGLAQAEQSIRSDATRIASQVDQIFDRSADNVSRAFATAGPRIGSDMDSAAARASRAFQGLGADVNRELNKIRDADVDVDIDIDRTEIGTAEREIRSLDSIPPPTIEIQADATEAIGEVADAFQNIDLRGAASNIATQFGAAMATTGPVGAAIGGAAAVLGATFGDDFMDGVLRGVNSKQTALSAQLRTGLGPEAAAPIGQAAGDAYGAGFGESASVALDAAIELERQLGDIDPSLNLRQASEAALTLADHLGVDVATSAELAGRLIAQGLARDATQAFDIMIDSAQRYGNQTDDVLDALREFGSVFSTMGIEGAAAARFIGDSYQQGLTSQVERAAEAVEQLRTRITDGDSQEAVEKLGLSFTDMQARVAAGGAQASEALALITDGLLNNVDAAERAAAANAIFGTAFETTADVDAFLQSLNNLSAAQVDVSGTTEEATGQVKEMRTSLDELSRHAEVAGTFVGDFLAVNLGNAERSSDGFRSAIEDAAGWLIDFRQNAQDAVTGTEDIIEAGTRATGTWEAMEPAARGAADATDDAGSSADDASGEFDALANAVDIAKNALDRWADDTGERAVISLMEATQDLSSSFDQNTVAAFSVRDGWDLQTEAGQRGATAALDLRREVVDVTTAFLDNKIRADQMAASLSIAESRFREAARAGGATEAQIDELTAAIFRVPVLTTPTVNAQGNAWSRIAELSGLMSGISGRTVNTFVNTYRTTINRVRGSTAGGSGRAAGGTVAAAAGGGGAEMLVNEEGEEAVRLPRGDVVNLPIGSTVFTAPDVERMRMEQNLGTGPMGGGGRGPLIEVNVTVMGTVLSNRDLAETIREEIQSGGLDGLGGVR